MIPQEPGLRPLPPPSHAAVDGAVQGVFGADPELAEALRAATAPKEPERGILDVLKDAWNGLIESFNDLHVEAPLLYWLVFAGLILVLALLLLHIGWTLTRAIREYRSPDDVARATTHVERRRHHDEWLEAAREQAATGDVRAGVRMLVLSLLALLDERRVLQYAASWTTREILGRLSARVGGSPAIATFGTGVERASYGPAEPLLADFTRLESAMLELATAVGDGEREARP